MNSIVSDYFGQTHCYKDQLAMNLINRIGDYKLLILPLGIAISILSAQKSAIKSIVLVSESDSLDSKTKSLLKCLQAEIVFCLENVNVTGAKLQAQTNGIFIQQFEVEDWCFYLARFTSCSSLVLATDSKSELQIIKIASKKVLSNTKV
jgi:hypothetical protein